MSPSIELRGVRCTPGCRAFGDGRHDVGPGSVAGTGGVDPDQAVGAVGAEVFGLQQRPTLGRGATQAAALFLLHHVVGAEGIAHAPAQHLLARAEGPGAGLDIQGQRVHPAGITCGQVLRPCMAQQHLALQAGARGGCRQWQAQAVAQFQLGHGHLRRHRRQPRLQGQGLGQRADRVGRAAFPLQPGFATGRGLRQCVGGRAGGQRRGQHRQQARGRGTWRSAARQARWVGQLRAHSSAGLRARYIGLSQASGTVLGCRLR